MQKKTIEKAEIDFNYTPSISSEIGLSQKLMEQFKGEIEQKTIKFPKELGEEHPFDFKELEELYKKFGFFTAVVDKYVDFVVGPGFYVECEDERALKIIEDFIRDVNLDTILRAWTKEALVKGNGFLEIGGSKKEGVAGLKVLNANYMYVVRNKVGKILRYNQYKAGFNKFAKEKIVPFDDPANIAHFAFNVVGDNAYGQGIGYAALKDIDNILSIEKDENFIMKRKANSPLHAKLGKVEGTTKIVPKPEDVTAFGQKMETMSNKTDWATDALVELKVVDFGNISDKFNSIREHYMAKLFYDFQIPPELMGMANIPEGMAAVRMDAFERRIQSIQAEAEKIIEESIFNRVLEANGFDVDVVHVEFQWGRPSTQEKNDRLTKIKEFMTNIRLSDTLYKLMEKDVVKLLDYPEDQYEADIETEEVEKQKELERIQPIVPGQNANPPQWPPKVPTPQPKPVVPPKAKEEFDKFDDFIKQQEIKNAELIKQQEEMKMLLQAKPVEVIKEEPKKEVEKIPEVKPKKENKIKKKLRRTKIIPTNELRRANVISTKKIKRTSVIPIYKNEVFEDINDIEEWLGFSYKKYLGQIHNALMNYDFEQIKALNEAEHEAGYLTNEQVERVRAILDEGFKKGSSIRDMTKKIDKIGLKDLYRMTEDGEVKKGASGLPILAKSSEKRSESIVRSEVTRIANKGAEEYYKENGIDKVSWVASIGNRTCEECEALNGQIFEINNHPEIPLHPMCRCTLSPVVELK